MINVFTDASFNADKKIAGVGIVYVWPSEAKKTKLHRAYFSTDNNETAELFAISTAITHLVPLFPTKVRFFSDSLGALRKLQRVFHHPDQRQIETIRDPSQKKILYKISASFEQMLDADFSFYYIHGHQKKTAERSNGYYNMLADQEASAGRLFGEMLLQSTAIPATCKTRLGRTRIDSQQPCWIVSPQAISFNYDDLGQPPVKPRLVAKHAGKQKETTVRRSKRTSRYRSR